MQMPFKLHSGSSHRGRRALEGSNPHGLELPIILSIYCVPVAYPFLELLATVEPFDGLKKGVFYGMHLSARFGVLGFSIQSNPKTFTRVLKR